MSPFPRRPCCLRSAALLVPLASAVALHTTLPHRSPVLPPWLASDPRRASFRRSATLVRRRRTPLRCAATAPPREDEETLVCAPEDSEETVLHAKRPFPFHLISQDMRDDLSRRLPLYASDWTDGFRDKRTTVPAVLFLYFSCLAPAISFGAVASQITQGSIGIVEFLFSSGVAGMAYAILAGQPMAFIAPTGLTLAFISGLFRFCQVSALPFFPVYAWVGLWTSLFMIALGLGGASKLIRYCTRFTDEVFNSLLSMNFIYEALSSIRRNFVQADPTNLTMPFVSLQMALCTYWLTLKTASFHRTDFFNRKWRSTIKNFGPVSVIIAATLTNLLPFFQRIGCPTLDVPHVIELAEGRRMLISLTAISPAVRLLCALPATLLTCLFFMDQNISTRLVNNKENKLKKGAAYNMDMVALGLITAGLSLVGLPWMCGATVQSLNHVRALSKYCPSAAPGTEELDSVIETRATGFFTHAAVASSIFLLPLLSRIPIPVVSGVFLFLGRKMMTGNTFCQRIREAFVERRRLPKEHPVQVLGKKKMNVYTFLQVLCLWGLWEFKQHAISAIFFPSVIGVLMFIRAKVLVKFFSDKDFEILDDVYI
uniref:Bicarbonate transporter-like transmembrane domain-containing protein n=1 Tax=Corethron hystrix TaxID=216773 RepID=A0A7S1FU71_9STRA|mmetsp:Transcript_29032/g.66484  ORF Transcript_29032/g.66484 Transcript_29032/m.66484 type:complete len:598 (+) Transcript_29032:212-2005(+)